MTGRAGVGGLESGDQRSICNSVFLELMFAKLENTMKNQANDDRLWRVGSFILTAQISYPVGMKPTTGTPYSCWKSRNAETAVEMMIWSDLLSLNLIFDLSIRKTVPVLCNPTFLWFVVQNGMSFAKYTRGDGSDRMRFSEDIPFETNNYSIYKVPICDDLWNLIFHLSINENASVALCSLFND